jgi:hypothetical protein
MSQTFEKYSLQKDFSLSKGKAKKPIAPIKNLNINNLVVSAPLDLASYFESLRGFTPEKKSKKSLPSLDLNPVTSNHINEYGFSIPVQYETINSARSSNYGNLNLSQRLATAGNESFSRIAKLAAKKSNNEVINALSGRSELSPLIKTLVTDGKSNKPKPKESIYKTSEAQYMTPRAPNRIIFGLPLSSSLPQSFVRNVQHKLNNRSPSYGNVSRVSVPVVKHVQRKSENRPSYSQTVKTEEDAPRRLSPSNKEIRYLIDKVRLPHMLTLNNFQTIYQN